MSRCCHSLLPLLYVCCFDLVGYSDADDIEQDPTDVHTTSDALADVSIEDRSTDVVSNWGLISPQQDQLQPHYVRDHFIASPDGANERLPPLPLTDDQLEQSAGEGV